MIIHGRQQILPPNMIIGRTQIQGACIGREVVFGSLWLNLSALQTILGAFGDDGWAVIKATNAYLNGIAASDRDKATALAGFINEDPMMVCSLGLEVQGVTMPIRWASVNGATFQMPVTYNTLADTIYAKYMSERGALESNMIFGNFNDVCIHCYWWRAGYNSSYYATTANDPTWGSAPMNVPLESYISKDNRWLKSSGVIRAQQTTEFTSSIDKSQIWMFTNEGNKDFKGKFERLEIDGVHKHLLVPIKHNGVDMMVDAFTPNSYVTKYNNAGSFTIPDISYTPSTP